jgi:hypothetical protein
MQPDQRLDESAVTPEERPAPVELDHLEPGDMVPAGDPWPEEDQTILEHGYARHGLSLTEPATYVQAMRDQQAAGFPYYVPSFAERELCRMWDEVFHMRARRGELTGTTLDRVILAQREAKRVKEEGEAHLRQLTRRKRTALVVSVAWVAAIAVFAVAAVIEGRL